MRTQNVKQVIKKMWATSSPSKTSAVQQEPQAGPAVCTSAGHSNGAEADSASTEVGHVHIAYSAVYSDSNSKVSCVFATMFNNTANTILNNNRSTVCPSMSQYNRGVCSFNQVRSLTANVRLVDGLAAMQSGGEVGARGEDETRLSAQCRPDLPLYNPEMSIAHTPNL